MRLTIRDAFHFLPAAAPGTPDYERADRTIKIFGLNERADVAQGRRSACGDYIARPEQYVNLKTAGTSPQRLGRLRNDLLRPDHRTAWVEIKRQQNSQARLRNLFEAAPEALNRR
jgi:hypothetical protein